MVAKSLLYDGPVYRGWVTTTCVGIARVQSDEVAEPPRSGTLVGLPQAYEPTPMPDSLVYPRQRHVPMKFRAPLFFATPRLRQRLGHESPVPP